MALPSVQSILPPVVTYRQVSVLVFGVGRWLAPRERTPLEVLIDETRSPADRLMRRVLRTIAAAFAVSLALAVVNAPITLAWQNLVSPAGIVLGPPLLLFTSIALIAGFLLLAASFLSPWLAAPFALLVKHSLAACSWLVHQTERLPGMWVYAPSPSLAWLAGFYLLVAAIVLLNGKWRLRFVAGLILWVVFGLMLGSRREPEFRMAFLSVGHGGCVVIETPDGRVLVYDAGTASGPDLIRRVVAPYLWSRGITRIDELFISHGDLDHFNGVPELAARFPIGQVTLTPTFAEKDSPGVANALAALDQRGIARRISTVSQQLTAGELIIDVLHPPAVGPAGNENARSLVLLIRLGDRRVLLTGDLEGAGQAEVLKQPIPPVDILLAPHHGAVNANARREPDGRFLPGAMAAWARPRFVVSSQEPRETLHLRAAYGPGGADVWDTATAGAIVVHTRGPELVIESFKSGEVKVIRGFDAPPRQR